MTLPPLYPILDVTTLLRAGIPLTTFARDLHNAGIRLLQYRDKDSSDVEFLQRAQQLRVFFPSADSTLILNDRAHLLAASGFDGLHIGQDDLPATAARTLIGADKYLGLSTHNLRQLAIASTAPLDYLAIGPIFHTQSKLNPDPVVGLEGIRIARASTSKPLVAIGGITLENVRSVFEAGADSVALISALLPTQQRSTTQLLADFLSQTP